MPAVVPVPPNTPSEVGINLSGQRYTFTYKFNPRQGEVGRWKLDIKDSDGNYLCKGRTLIERWSPDDHLIDNGLPDGLLYVTNVNNTKEPVGRNNLGLGKDYELWYYTDLELR